MLGNHTEDQRQIRIMVDRFRDSNNATHMRRMMNRAVYPDNAGIDPAELEQMSAFVLRRANQSPFTAIIQGVLEFRKGNLDAAEEQFMRARSQANNFWMFHALYQAFRARIAFRQSDWDKALHVMQNLNRLHELDGPRSVTDFLGNGFVDVVPCWLVAGEAGDEISNVLDQESPTLAQRRLGIEALVAMARRAQFRRDRDAYQSAVFRIAKESAALIAQSNDAGDVQRALGIVWTTQHTEQGIRMPPGQVMEMVDLVWPDRTPESPLLKWVALEPKEYQSQSGSEMEVLGDGSIVMRGRRPARDTYTLEYVVPAGKVVAIRFEQLAHDDLFSYGPGRSFNGNSYVNELEMKGVWPGGEVNLVEKVSSVTAAFHEGNFHGQHRARAMLDGNLETFWGLWPKSGRDHMAVIGLKDEWDAPEGATLKVVIRSVSELFRQHTVGRLRMSVNSSIGAMECCRIWPAASTESVSYWSVVGNALMDRGNYEAAKAYVERSLHPGSTPTAFDWLVAARYFIASGDLEEGEELRERALGWATRYAPGDPVFENLLEATRQVSSRAGGQGR